MSFDIQLRRAAGIALISVAVASCGGSNNSTVTPVTAAPTFSVASGPYTRSPAYGTPIYNWTGFYIGGHLGGAFSGSNNFNGLVLSNYDAQFLGGVQAGADYQFAANWVAGVEGQYSWLGRNTISALFPAGLAYNSNQRGLGSVTGRIGYTFGTALAYIRGGYAYSDYAESLTLGGAPTLTDASGGSGSSSAAWREESR